MASNSGRRSGSSGRSSGRKRVVIGADETTRVRYDKDAPQVESERRKQRQPRPEGSRTRPKGGPSPTGAGKRIAAEKRDERERRQRAIARRRLLLISLVVLAAAAVVYGLVALWRAPLFPVRDVVVTGNSHLSKADIIARAEIPTGATLPRLAVSRVEERLARDPWIATVAVDRDYPSTVRIAVTERTPAALVDRGGTDIWVASSDAHWLGPRSAEDTAELIAIRDVPSLEPTIGASIESSEVVNAIAVLKGLGPELRAKVRAVSAPSVDKTALVLKDDVQVFVGSSEDIGKKSRLALEILKREKNLVYVNVRVISRPTWRGLDTPD